MKQDPFSKVLVALLTLACAGFAWVLLHGPTGQPDSRRVRPAELAGKTEVLPNVSLATLPTVPFAGLARPFTDNTERYQYNGPGRDMDDDGVNDPEVRLGVVSNFSGPVRAYGVAMQQGIDMALEEANASGGYRGKKFVAVSRDDLFDMGANANAMVKLVFDERVRAIIGAVHSGNTHVGVRIALKCEVPQITSVSTDPTITEVGIPWAFRCLADDRLQGRALAAYMFGRKDYRRLVLLNQMSRYGKMGIMEIRGQARKLGREVLLQMQFEGGQRDYSAIVGRVARLAPDAIVIWGLYREAALLVKALRAKGVTTPALGADGLTSPAFSQSAGAAAEGVVVTYPFDAERDSPVTRAFADKYRAKYGRAPDSFVAHAYDAANIVIAAIRKAGLNRARIRDAMAATRDFPGVTGNLTFDGTGNLIGKVELAVVKGGAFVKLPESEGPP